MFALVLGEAGLAHAAEAREGVEAEANRLAVNAGRDLHDWSRT